MAINPILLTKGKAKAYYVLVLHKAIVAAPRLWTRNSARQNATTSSNQPLALSKLIVDRTPLHLFIGTLYENSLLIFRSAPMTEPSQPETHDKAWEKAERQFSK